MITEDTLFSVFRYFKECKNLDIEYNDLWKSAARTGLEFRCKDRNITEDEIIWQLIEDDINTKYEDIILSETLTSFAKFNNINTGDI